MSSRIYVADARRLSNQIRDKFKRENCAELGLNSGDRELYHIGHRHAARRIPQNILESMLPQARESLTPRFSIDISRGLFNELGNDIPLYLLGLPSDIETMGDLREQMSELGYTTLYSQEVDDRMIQDATERLRAHKKGDWALAKRTLKEIHGVKWLRRFFREAYQDTIVPATSLKPLPQSLLLFMD